MNDYVQIKSVSIDMSTEKAPYNRIYAKPIEKQGDVLLCEFETANYDMSKKGKDFTTGISEEMYLDQLKVKENMIKSYQKENARLKELLKECKRYIDIWGYTDTHGNLLLPQIEQALGEDK